MDFADYVTAVRRHWRGFLAITLGAILLAAGITLLTPKVYTATAAGLVKNDTAGTVSEQSISDMLAKSRVKSYVDVAQGRAVARRVAQALNLPDSPSSLIARVDVTQPTDTVLLRVSVAAPTGPEASLLADAWVHALAAEVASIEDPSGNNPGVLQVVPIEAAAVPTTPTSPVPTRNLGLGLILGLVAGLIYALVAARFDRRLRAPSDVEHLFDVTVAGVVPEHSALRRKAGDLIPIVVAGQQARNGIAESILKLRTNLKFMRIDNPPRVIVVTSPLPSDGKSTISANLAAAFAVSGSPTLLIDADLRRPVVAESFGLIEGVGLSDVLVGEAAFNDVAQASAIPNLTVLASGTIPPNPSELLGSATMKRLLEDVSQRFTVIIDAPPLLPVTDAAVVTANADGALIVISAGVTEEAQLQGCLNQLEAINGTTLGVVLNKVSKRKGGTGEYDGYYGGYYRAYAPAIKDETDRPIAGEGHRSRAGHAPLTR